jgi:HAD superfamily hydrolase (TIGR01509 family)
LQVDANLAAAGFQVGDFDAVVSADACQAIKPAPDIFLAAARLMGCPPEECVVVEDAAAGMQAARHAGE